MNQKQFKLSVLTLSILAASHAMAQVPPTGTSGQAVKETAPALQAPTKKSSAVPALDAPQAPSADKTPYLIRNLKISGNTVYPTSDLLPLISDAENKVMTIAEIEVLVSAVSRLYRDAGYPVVRVRLNAEQLRKNNLLDIQIVEGRYGEVTVSGESAEDPVGPKMFTENIKKGELITSESLERTTLLIDDLPGIQVGPIISPGKELGAGDITFLVNKEANNEGRIGYDNAGSRTTGKHRVRLDYAANGVLTFGDRVFFTGILSDDQLKVGSINWELPITGSGLKALVGYARTDYVLGKQYGDLEANGFANVTTLQLSYPVIRSQDVNLYASAGYVAKRMEDRWDATPDIYPTQTRTINTTPIGMRFDVRDSFNGGGITFGRVQYTTGHANLGSQALLADQDPNEGTASNTSGPFRMVNFDIARIQKLPDRFSLYGRYSYQRANRNLDPSEQFSIGGPNGVRAYPTFEGTADRGYIIQTELRYNLEAPGWTGFIFHDQGKAKPNQPIAGVYTPFRELAAWGVGSRYDSKTWDMEGTIAWRSLGGETLAENRDRDPRIFFNLGYKF